MVRVMITDTIAEEAKSLRQSHGNEAMLVAIERSLMAWAKGEGSEAEFWEAVALAAVQPESCDA